MIADHYRLVEQIGSGGTGVVWRAVDERLQRSVAIKQIHIKPSLPPAERDVLRQRATREARNAARFQHPNAIVVFDITEHGGDPCLVMEYMKSRSLAQVLSSQGPLPLPQVARIGEQVAAALIAAHQAGIVHRDVKPGNILLDDHGTVKITDFGISRATGDVTLTETGLICGTAAYLAPEVARGADPTPAADVFALGATLFHALEGEPPFGSGNPLKVLYAAANGQVSEPQNAGPATDFLLDLLEADPRLRPTMQEAREQLAQFAGYPGASAEHAGFVPAREAFDRNGHAGGAAVSTMETPAPGRTRGAGAAPAPRRRSQPRPDSDHGESDDRAPQRAPNHPPTTTQPVAGGSGSSGGVRRAVLIGGIAGAAVVGGVLWLGSSDSDDGGSARADTSVTSSAPRTPGTTATTAPALGSTPSTGQVEWVQAGQLLEQFYMNPAGSWSLLTPAAQQAYGSRQEFEQYWSTRTVQSFSRIEAFKGNNPDGSVDMRVNNLSYGGQTRNPVLRVVNSGGTLLIDSDTH
ncbi:serine/threonine protein kinase [Nocardia flavorosea]|nr:serine/threonine protein kinase [Nocardia flavorosea]